MAKRDKNSKQTKTTAATSTADATTPGDAMEQRLMAFAEQLGRIAGTVQARAEGWMDRETLNKQIAGVRDSAAELLDQLADGVTSMTKTAKDAVTATTAKAPSKGRSGGIVDAPGKKHRKPMPIDPRAAAADARRATMRSSKASMKTMKTRGRG
jgi:uncharacterized phage infection (PIP) family protein YhgE